VLLLAPWGLVRGLRRGEPWARAALLVLAYALLLFLFLHVKSRYRIQLLPALLPAAALGAAQLLDVVLARSGRQSPGGGPDAVEIAIGCAGSALFALLVFGA
jgi:hypothetical protein